MSSDPPSETAATDDGTERDVTSDERTWAILVHAAALAGFAVPFGNVLGPLIVWLVKRDESRFVDDTGTAVLNFQLTWSVLFVAALLSILVGIGLVLVPLVGMAWLILVVIGMIRASKNEVYDFPLTVAFVN